MTSIESFENNSKTFSYSLGSQIHCFALNNSGNRIIVGGKGDWELLTIGDDRFISNSILNPRGLTLRIMDICWSKLDDNLVASCGSNGELHKLLVTPTELKLESAYKFHDKTINKIHIHPNKPNLLISGGQDGNIKLIDFRIRNESNPVSVFAHIAEDKVTDLQFNPSSSLSDQFASGSENGCVYIWDTRQPKYQKKFSPHFGTVHLDWHPEEKYWLATATLSKDRQISISDLSSEKLNVIHSITNSESVASIKWRPKRKMQIGACLGGFDPHLYVWDLMRPYVPYASFDSIPNKVQNFSWRNDPKCLIVSTRVQNRSKLYNTYISEALRPIDHSTLVTVEMDKYGSIAFALGNEDSKKEEIPSTELDTVSSCSDNYNEKFQITQSVLYFDSKQPLVRTDWFYYSATNYKFNNGTFEELCDHNAQVAHYYYKFDVFKNWKILKTLYKENEKYEVKEDNSNKSSPTLSVTKQMSNKLNTNDNNSTIQIPLSAFSQVSAIVNTSTSSNTSEQISSSSSDIASDDSPLLTANGNTIVPNIENITSSSTTKLNKDSNSTADKLSFRQTDNFYSTITSDLNTLSNLELNDDNNLINTSQLNKFEDEDDFSILPNDIVEFNNMEDLVKYFNNNEKISYELEHQNHGNNFKTQTNIANTVQTSTLQTSELSWFSSLMTKNNNQNNLNENQNFNDEKYNQKSIQTIESKTKNSNTDLEQNKISDLSNYFLNQTSTYDDISKMNFDDYFYKLLQYYIDEENDLTTAIFMFLIATSKNKFDKSKIEQIYLDEWFSQYIELLAKFELWNLRTEIVKAYQTDTIRNLTQKSIVYNVMCAICKKTIKQNTYVCISCRKNVFLCSYCHLPVKKLYAWCHNCNHGGHLNHIVKWFKNNTKCVTGCGCNCSPNYNQLQDA